MEPVQRAQSNSTSFESGLKSASLVTRVALLWSARAAAKAGHPVAMFLTDEGVKFTRDPKFLELLAIDGVAVSVCEYSCELTGLHEKTGGIIYGSQYDNAGMLHNSERVLVF